MQHLARLCRPFGSLGEPELLHSALALASFDTLLALGLDALNDVAMGRQGLGWDHTLRGRRQRW